MASCRPPPISPREGGSRSSSSRGRFSVPGGGPGSSPLSLERGAREDSADGPSARGGGGFPASMCKRLNFQRLYFERSATGGGESL